MWCRSTALRQEIFDHHEQDNVVFGMSKEAPNLGKAFNEKIAEIRPSA